jgi:high-affinity Fe2+/Pb2+ permease
MARFRKAFVAAAGAAVSAAVGAVAKDGMPDAEGEWATLVATALAAAVIAGLAVWRVRNEPAS